ncbi:DEAD/DEAH box helicase [Candidatus Kaiserbacteria bacterium]|nr:DEAD/DEAH box helicase [Candidatus Kaiserbacteria bacterium]
MRKHSSETSRNNTRVSYHKKPAHLSTEAWQKELRKQFGADKKSLFDIAYIPGEHPVFGDYRVTNATSGSTYKVALRSADPGPNFCSCPDFKSSGLGTCKHIEAVLAHIRARRTLAPLLKEHYRPAYTSVYLKYGSTRTVMLRIGREQEREFSALARHYFDASLALFPAALDTIDEFLSRAARLSSSFRCYDDAMDHLIALRDARERERLFAAKHTRLTNKLVTTTLYPYQQDGILFAARAGRALIADEMGLGKTIQALALAELLKKKYGIRRVLIVCPTSLKYQWHSEIAKFTKSGSVVVEGAFLARQKQYSGDTFYTIASYNVVGADRAALEHMEPDLVILDEAQRIKNWDTKVSREVKRIRSPYALVLTGTPIENKLEELYSIVQFLDPFTLGPLHAFLERHQTRDLHGKVVGYRELNRIRETLARIVLRRTKKEVLSQLPERIDKIICVPLTQMQAEVHREHADTVARLVNRWKRYGFLDEASRKRLMVGLNCMRMACDSTYILDEETRHDTKIDEVMHILEDLLESGDEKAVVFSQWERMTRLVKAELEKRGVEFAYLHGGIPSKDRKALLDTFREDPRCRVFLSTDAGGVGLNLQTASLIVNLDIPWNPAVLEQRIGRIYRHGQKRRVRVINLVSKDSIEERMLDVLAFKSSLFAGALDRGENEVFMSGGKFKQFMETVEKVADQPKVPPITDVEAEHETAEVRPLFPLQTPSSAPAISASDTDTLSSLAKAVREFADTLANPQSVQSLIHTEHGKTFLKIPLERADILIRTISAITEFLRMTGQLR